jgi:hypothetical protein
VTSEQSAQPPAPEMRMTFDDSLAGRRAICEGGAQVAPGAKVGGRETFSGTLTGDVMEHGDPPWRWFKMGNLSVRPEYVGTEDHVWCEESFVWFEDEE